MARTDIHLDAMLRHLGAAYYESLHGRATRADVSRALGTVEEHLYEQAQRHPAGAARTAREHAPVPDGPRRPGGWSRKVRDVMTTSVVAAVKPGRVLISAADETQVPDRRHRRHRCEGFPSLNG